MNQLNSMNIARKWLNVSLGYLFSEPCNLINHLPEIPFWLFLIQKLHTEQMTISVMVLLLPLPSVWRIFWQSFSLSLFLRTKFPWRDVRTQENNFTSPSLTHSFEIWASINGDYFLEGPPSNCHSAVTEWCPVECGVGWRLTLCKYINPSTALEAAEQGKPDNEFCPSNIRPVYIFHLWGRSLLIQKLQEGLGPYIAWQVARDSQAHPHLRAHRWGPAGAGNPEGPHWGVLQGALASPPWLLQEFWGFKQPMCTPHGTFSVCF